MTNEEKIEDIRNKLETLVDFAEDSKNYLLDALDLPKDKHRLIFRAGQIFDKMEYFSHEIDKILNEM